jgi:hypothetical protein
MNKKNTVQPAKYEQFRPASIRGTNATDDFSPGSGGRFRDFYPTPGAPVQRFFKMSDPAPNTSSAYRKAMNFIMANQPQAKPSEDHADFYNYINAAVIPVVRVELPALLFAEISNSPDPKLIFKQSASGAENDEYHGHCEIGGGCVMALIVSRLQYHFFKYRAPVPPDVIAVVAKMLKVSPDLLGAYWIDDHGAKILLLEYRLIWSALGTGQTAGGTLYRIAYVSTAAKLFDHAELLQLLQQARERNVQAGITGMALYKDGQIMQILEGLEKSVREVFAHICRRPEQHGIMILFEEHIEQRHFTDWSMAFGHLDLPQGQSAPGYSNFLNTPLPPTQPADTPSRCEKLLLLFKKNIR